MKIGGACLNQIPMHWDNNLNNIISAIEQAKKESIKILCLPELCITGYGCEDMFLSDWLPAKALQKLQQILPYCLNITVCIGLPIKFRGHRYNTTAVIDNGKIKGIYAKHHLANDGVHYEPRWFDSWPLGETDTITLFDEAIPFGTITINLHGIRVGFEICEDAWHEKRPARDCYNGKVDLLLNPSASHFAFGKAKYRESIVVNSSEQFNCCYLYTNLLGNEAGRMIYDGDIMIAQKGKMLRKNKRLSFLSFNLLAADVNFENAQASEQFEINDYAGSQEEFGKAAALALWDYKRKAKSNGFVLSLSGGADSATCAVLVAEMVRYALEEYSVQDCLEILKVQEENPDSINHLSPAEVRKQVVNKILHTAYQGTENSSKDTLQAAKELAQSIGAEFHSWTIDTQIDTYRDTIEKAIGRPLSWEQDDITLQNIQARARSPIIWMLANLHNCLLLTTSNRSEGDVGYTTMDGDTSGSIAPIAAVDKHFIRQWLIYAEEHLEYTGLRYVNSLAPTAELRPLHMTQTDEKDLMPYALLVQIERLAIKEKQSPITIYQNLSATSNIEPQSLKMAIQKFFKLWSYNQWKRERIAPSFHLDDFNVDPRTWCRFPILSSGFQEELEELLQL